MLAARMNRLRGALRADIDERDAINLASVSGGERIKPKAITHRLSYPVNRRIHVAHRPREEREPGPFNGLVSSNKLNRGRIVRRAISPAIRNARGQTKGSEKSRRDQRLP